LFWIAETGTDLTKEKKNFIKGAGTFVTTVVVGIISLIGPFKVTRRPFLRDILLYLSMTIYMLFMVLDGQIVLGESIALIVVYVCYICVVVFGRMIHQRMKKHDDQEKEDNLKNGKIAFANDSINNIAAEQEALLKPYEHEEWEPDVAQPLDISQEVRVVACPFFAF